MHKAVDLLARREHSEKELKQKLSRYDFESDLIDGVLEELIERDYLNDWRFARLWMSHRIDKGYGPYQVESGVIAKGVSRFIAAEILIELDVDWMQHLHQVYGSRYSRGCLDDDERLKQARFLQYRGFSREMISELLWS